MVRCSNEIKTGIIFLLLFSFLLTPMPIVRADSDTIIVCGGDSETIIGCPIGDNQTGNPYQLPVPLGGGKKPSYTLKQFGASVGIPLPVIIVIIMVIILLILILLLTRRKKKREQK